jgi:predicted nucleic acid-binding protein
VSRSDRCLLDSSSLMLLMKKVGGDLVPRLGSFITLDLTTYEMGNILWKEGYLSKSLTRDEVASLASTTEQILTLVERISMSPQDVGRTLELAENEGLTFYDASYLQAAIDGGFSLVTEDAKLRRAAKKHVAVKGAAEL